ncbi:MAG: hypothetical protein HYR96_15240 [Deltaproteobacteria bacterium]|nr:hypothetical protein [Deltaproteobacteria bacterium]MBI3296252.1 hypothetical protein [Deltaproteobacteria bacterium]
MNDWTVGLLVVLGSSAFAGETVKCESHCDVSGNHFEAVFTARSASEPKNLVCTYEVSKDDNRCSWISDRIHEANKVIKRDQILEENQERLNNLDNPRPRRTSKVDVEN